MTGQRIHNLLDKRGKEIHDVYPYHDVWIIEQETFSIALPMFLLIFRVPQSCLGVAMIWCFQVKIGFKDH